MPQIFCLPGVDYVPENRFKTAVEILAVVQRLLAVTLAADFRFMRQVELLLAVALACAQSARGRNSQGFHVWR